METIFKLFGNGILASIFWLKYIQCKFIYKNYCMILNAMSLFVISIKDDRGVLRFSIADQTAAMKGACHDDKLSMQNEMMVF